MDTKSIFPIDLNKKLWWGLNIKSWIWFVIVMVVTSYFIFFHSSGPDDDVIKKDIIAHQWMLKIKPELFKSYDIDNSYTRKDGDQTIYIYDYTVHLTTGENDSGTIGIVQQGNTWYDNPDTTD